MAMTKADIKQHYPLPVYNYRVTIAGQAVGFSDASGLTINYDPITYKESPTSGNLPGPRVMTMPGQSQAPTVTLSKGVVRTVSIQTLYNWIHETQLNLIDKKDIMVELCDETGAPVITWKIINAFPTRLSAPDFSADSNSVAIEQLELTGDSIQMSEGT